MSLRDFLEAQTQPVIFPLPVKWPCVDYSLRQWGEVLPDPFEFRHDSQECPAPFEVQQGSRFRATIQQFAEAVDEGKFTEQQVDLRQRWVYSAYNWMSTRRVTKKDCLDWTFFDSNEVDCSNTTIWFGSRGAFTPCHRDSYAINLSVQLIGSKEWLLFPPSDNVNLYETRLPYEETTIFSSVDFNRRPLDTEKWPLIQRTGPYRVVLQPGQVIFVPKHWWHFVRCVDDVCVNVNNWFQVDSDAEDKVDEALAALLVSRIQDLVEGSIPAINSEAPVGDKKVVLEAIKESLEELSFASARFTGDSDVQRSSRTGSALRADVVGEIQRKFSISKVERCSLSDLILPGSATQTRASTMERSREFSTNEIFRSILDPEVLALIRRKLIRTYCGPQRGN